MSDQTITAVACGELSINLDWIQRYKHRAVCERIFHNQEYYVSCNIQRTYDLII